MNDWYVNMTADEAKAHFGERHWGAVIADLSLAKRLASGAWDCNNRLNYAGYCAAIRLIKGA